MNVFETMQLFSMSGQKLDALWQFFVTVHIATYGALFVFHKLKAHQIVISVVSYIAFSLINIRAKIYEYEFYDSLLLDLKEVKMENNVNVMEFMNSYNVDDRIAITFSVHIISFIFLVYLLKKARSL